MDQNARPMLTHVAHDLQRAIEHKLDVLQPLRVLQIKKEVLVIIRVNRAAAGTRVRAHRVGHGHLMNLAQALSHHMNILNVQEEYLTIGVVVLVFVAAAGASICDGIYQRPRVHNKQLIKRVGRVEFEHCVQVGLVVLTFLGGKADERLTASEESGPERLVVVLDPADHGNAVLGAEFADEAQLLVRHRLGHDEHARIRLAELEVHVDFGVAEVV